MNVNPAAALALITSLYEQLHAAHQRIAELSAATSDEPTDSGGFVPCDPADGPAR